MCVYIYIYIQHYYQLLLRLTPPVRHELFMGPYKDTKGTDTKVTLAKGHFFATCAALLVQCCLSNTASSVLSCAVYSVKVHHLSANSSTVLKDTCVGQAVLDKWFPLMTPRT